VVLKRKTICFIAGGLIFTALVFAVLAFCASRIDRERMRPLTLIFSRDLLEPLTNTDKQKNLVEFELQIFQAEKYAYEKNYAAAHEAFTAALGHATRCFNKPSYFLFLINTRVASFEQQFGHWDEVEKAITSALEALPTGELIDRFHSEERLIWALREQNKYRLSVGVGKEHLKLAEKLVAKRKVDRIELIRALAMVAYDLDQAGGAEEAEGYWQRHLAEVQSARDARVQYEPCLLAIVIHEAEIHHDTDATTHLEEAKKLAERKKDERLLAAVLETKADFLLRREDLEGSESALRSALSLRENVKAPIAYTYRLLSELARRRHDLEQRYELLKQSLVHAKENEQESSLKEIVIVDVLRNRPDEAQRSLSKLIQAEQKQLPSGFWIIEDDASRLCSLGASRHRAHSATGVNLDSLKKASASFGGAPVVFMNRESFRSLIDDLVRGDCSGTPNKTSS
jgi:tetratricopeptide (TPR) repeat protein